MSRSQFPEAAAALEACQAIVEALNRYPEWVCERLGHIWKLEDDGTLDIFVTDFGYHNGPGCARCHFSFCHHCENEAEMGVPEELRSYG